MAIRYLISERISKIQEFLKQQTAVSLSKIQSKFSTYLVFIQLFFYICFKILEIMLEIFENYLSFASVYEIV